MAMNNLAFMWAEQGENLGDAERLSRKALGEKPDKGMFADTLGWVLYKKRDYEAAVEILNRAVTLSPNSGASWSHLGEALSAIGKAEEAMGAWNHALALNPTNDERKMLKRKVMGYSRQRE